jgi:hypothetical protein
MESEREPGHTHRCEDPDHEGDGHWCTGCKSRFWTAVKSATFVVRQALRMTNAPSSVARRKEGTAPEIPQEEIAVSDATATEATEPVATEVTENDAGDPVVEVGESNVGIPTVNPDGEGGTDEPAEDAPKTRGERTPLEADVKAVTDDYVTGALTLEEGETLTPHRIAKLVHERRGEGQPKPSAGAVSAVLDRWVAYGFCTVSEKPVAFADYTDEGREKGLTAMKEQHRERAKKARADAKAADASA